MYDEACTFVCRHGSNSSIPATYDNTRTEFERERLVALVGVVERCVVAVGDVVDGDGGFVGWDVSVAGCELLFVDEAVGE